MPSPPERKNAARPRRLNRGETGRAGQINGLDSRIDALISPAERALADIAVGATLLDRPFVGMLRMYKVRGE